MGFKDSVFSLYRNMFDFEGRASRSEYWWNVLFFLLVLIITSILVFALSPGSNFDSDDFSTGSNIVFWTFAIWLIIGIIPWIALSVRRFHDLNQTGWFVLIFNIAGSIPMVGLLATIGQFVWFALPGTSGPNKYGDDPLNPYSGLDIFD